MQVIDFNKKKLPKRERDKEMRRVYKTNIKILIGMDCRGFFLFIFLGEGVVVNFESRPVNEIQFHVGMVVTLLKLRADGSTWTNGSLGICTVRKGDSIFKFEDFLTDGRRFDFLENVFIKAITSGPSLSSEGGYNLFFSELVILNICINSIQLYEGCIKCRGMNKYVH